MEKSNLDLALKVLIESSFNYGQTSEKDDLASETMTWNERQEIFYGILENGVEAIRQFFGDKIADSFQEELDEEEKLFNSISKN